jgi:ATP-dependent helicase/nuclease subunit A
MYQVTEASEDAEPIIGTTTTAQPTALTVTSDSLSGNDYLSREKPSFAFRRPEFVIKADRKLTATERGTALHLAMQFVDFSRLTIDGGSNIERRSLVNEVFRLQDNHTLTPEQADSVDVDKILNFFMSPLGRRVLTAQTLHRELKFSLLVLAPELIPSLSQGDELSDKMTYPETANASNKVLLQGVVDLCVEDADGLTVIDYKSDYISRGEVNERAEFYRPQIKAYALALSRLFNKPVREAWLYFFNPDYAFQITNGY